MLNSFYKPLLAVAMPEFQGRQLYMAGFDLADPVMPKGFEDFFKPVLSLCAAAKASVGKAYLTVDEKVLKAGETQRRPGPHVDGAFLEHKMDWGGGGGWDHTCNAVPFARMPVIVASDVPLCKAWEGKFALQPAVDHPTRPDGDLTHYRHFLGRGEILERNLGYILSPDCVHESLPTPENVQRTFVRIALPTDFPVI